MVVMHILTREPNRPINLLDLPCFRCWLCPSCTSGLSGMSIIIAQGPMHPDYHGPDTTCAFWQMVHEQRPKAIACLAEVAPGYGGLACYWPQEVRFVFSQPTQHRHNP